MKHINLNIQERSVNPKQDKPKEIHARQCIIKLLKTKGRKKMKATREKCIIDKGNDDSNDCRLFTRYYEDQKEVLQYVLSTERK